MEKLRNWLGEHKWLVLSGMAGLALFAYLFMRRSSSLSQGAIAATPTTPAVAGGGTSDSGALNLSSGTTTPLPSNLVPPNCGPGMVPTPNIISQGQGQPSFVVGWTCQPVPTPTPPNMVPFGPALPAPPAPITPAPPRPAQPPPPAAPPAPAPKTLTVCAWPNWCGSLWGIAQHITGDGNRWPELFHANADKISNPNLIFSGTVLTLPQGW